MGKQAVRLNSLCSLDQDLSTVQKDAHNKNHRLMLQSSHTVQYRSAVCW